jgi:hypothetical protein
MQSLFPDPADPGQERLRLGLQISGLASLYEFGRKCVMTAATALSGWATQHYSTAPDLPSDHHDFAMLSTPSVNPVWPPEVAVQSYCQSCSLAYWAAHGHPPSPTVSTSKGRGKQTSCLPPPPPPPPLVPPCAPKPPVVPDDSRPVSATTLEGLRPITPQSGPGARRQGALDPAMVASIMQQSSDLDLDHTTPPPSFVWRDHAAHGRSEILGAQTRGGGGARAPPTIPDYHCSVMGSSSGAGGSNPAVATTAAAASGSQSITDSMYCELGRKMMSMCSALLRGDGGALAAMGDRQLGATTVEALSNRAMESFLDNDDGLDGAGIGSDSDDDDDNGGAQNDTGGGGAAAGPSHSIPSPFSALAPLEAVEAVLAIPQIRHTAAAAVQAAAQEQVLTDLRAAGPNAGARPAGPAAGPGLAPDSTEVQLLQSQSGWSAAVALTQTIVDDKLPTDYLEALKDKAARAPDQTAILQAARLQGPHVTKGRAQLRHQIGRADIGQLLSATENLEIWARLNLNVVGQVAWADS